MAILTSGSSVASANGININTDFIQTKSCAVLARRSVDYIVMHYTGNKSDTALANAKYFYNNTLSASAHFFVDEASIYQSTALKDRAWHCGANTYYHSDCRNANSIGIEMCTSGGYTVSAASIENAAHLAAQCFILLGISSSDAASRLLRHYDVTHKSCPAQWVSDPSGFDSFKERVCTVLRAAEITEYTDINAIIWELNHRGIISDSALWIKKCAEDANIYWLCRKLCQYIRTKQSGETADYAYTDIGQIVWDLSFRGIISDSALWTAYAANDINVYYLLQKGLHYCRTY